MEPAGITAKELITITSAIVNGTIARIITIKEDFRKYPSYPNGYLIQIITGFVAALGAVAIPSLLSKNFVAVTFLTLALQQLDVRKMEKEKAALFEACRALGVKRYQSQKKIMWMERS